MMSSCESRGANSLNWVRAGEDSESTNAAPTQPGIEARHLADAQADRETRIPLRTEPNDEPVEVWPQQGQGRKAGVGPRKELGKHRDLQ